MPRPRSTGTPTVDERTRLLDAHIDQLASSAPKLKDWTPSRQIPHRILGCIAGTHADENVLGWTREMARLFGADVTLLHVTRPSVAFYPPGPSGIPATTYLLPDPEAERAHAERTLTDARTRVSEDVPEVALLHREGHPGDEIVRAARELATDLIIVGHHEGGAIDRLLVGSTTDHVKNHAHANVIITRTLPAPGPILAAVDGSAASRQAAALADAIARRWSATLHVLYVVPPRWHSAADETTAEELRARALAQGSTTPLEGLEMDLRMGDARDVIRVQARGMKASLIAVGARGTSGLRSLMPGSVSNALSHDAPTSILLVRDDPA